MRLNASPTELTTAATDAVLALLCLVILAGLWNLRAQDPRKVALWCWVFGLLALASVLGVVAHGFDLGDPVLSVLWKPLFLSLGLSVALFFVGGVHDWLGEEVGRRILPWAVLAAFGFFAVTQLSTRSFLIFVVYETVAMVGALAIHVRLAMERRAGARAIAIAIMLIIAAAAVQASDLRMQLLVPFDHNGLFHLVQMVAVVLMVVGVRASLAPGGIRERARVD